MKSALIFTGISLLATAVRGSVVVHELRAAGGYVPNPRVLQSFTSYSGCGSPGKPRELRSTR